MQNKTEDPSKSNPPPYRVTDLYLATFLRCQGLSFLTTEKEGRRITFVFEGREDIEEIVRRYFNNSLVKVQDFKGALRDFKQIVFEAREGGRS